MEFSRSAVARRRILQLDRIHGLDGAPVLRLCRQYFLEVGVTSRALQPFLCGFGHLTPAAWHINHDLADWIILRLQGRTDN